MQTKKSAVQMNGVLSLVFIGGNNNALGQRDVLMFNRLNNFLKRQEVFSHNAEN